MTPISVQVRIKGVLGDQYSYPSVPSHLKSDLSASRRVLSPAGVLAALLVMLGFSAGVGAAAERPLAPNRAKTITFVVRYNEVKTVDGAVVKTVAVAAEPKGTRSKSPGATGEIAPAGGDVQESQTVEETSAAANASPAPASPPPTTSAAVWYNPWTWFGGGNAPPAPAPPAVPPPAFPTASAVLPRHD